MLKFGNKSYLLMIILFIVLVCVYFIYSNKNLSTHGWLKTQAKIISLKEHFSQYGSSLEIKYQYRVNEKSYVNNRYSTKEIYKSINVNNIYQYKEQLLLHPDIYIFYNPNAPKESVIKR